MRVVVVGATGNVGTSLLRVLADEPEVESIVGALRELLSGIAEGAGTKTPPLDPATGGPLRVREFLTGVGRKSGA